MRKSMTRVLLLALILALLCVGALAAEEASATVNIKDKDYSVVPTENYEKFILSYTADEGEQLVMLLKGEEAPNASNIYYIDQQTGSGNFTIYPKQLTSGTYRLLVANSNTAKEVATIDYTAAGVTVSGTITSYKDDTGTVTISLLNGENVVDSKTGTGNSVQYSFDAVSEGTYTLQVKKAGHAPLTEEITVGADAITKNMTILQYGDVNASGKTNSVDATLVLRTGAKMTGYTKVVADVNGNGKVNSADATLILRHRVGAPFPVEG